MGHNRNRNREPLPQKVCFQEERHEINEPRPQKVCFQEERHEINEPLPQKVCFQEARQEIKEPLSQKVCLKVLKEVQTPFPKEIHVKEVRKVRGGRKEATNAYKRWRVDSSSVT